MNAVTESIFVDQEEFFAPSTSDFVDGMISQYTHQKSQIEQVAAIMAGEHGGVVDYFITANADRAPYSKNLWDPVGAIKALDAAFWSKSIHLTELLNYMPQKRRDEWNEQIQKRTCPAFEEQTVRATLQDLLGKRHQFFAERVDGLFRSLSNDHVTNSPAAFGKRFILGYMLHDYGSWCSFRSERAGLINDLRCVIAKFMGREEPGYSSTDALVKSMQANWGEWIYVDGNAFKIRLYKKGTAHIEVHPDMAWRLNSVLASIYPSAIPPEFRTKQKSKPKNIELMQKPLPTPVLRILENAEPAYEYEKLDNGRNSNYKKVFIKNAIGKLNSSDKHVQAQIDAVMTSIGGVKQGENWQFDYDALDTIRKIAVSGIIPDDKSHQFYPTPEKVANIAVEIAGIEPHHSVLEPSAGIGNLADLAPYPPHVTCVEVSELRCGILNEKGYVTHQADFIEWAEKQPHETFDRIIMNPPFDRGQWKAHVEHAAPLLKRGGRLVAILPEGAEGKFYLDKFNCWYPQRFENEFSGTSVSVCILVADKA